ncbi:hypothetical protein [Oleiphilus sp. HI0117]|nr:hypothetical protein [Oleiphilus sp. HI0117]KZY41265.1 hypothetical protein A3732_18495 [Oleiphilus sp. HI0050]KZZ35203.1 hypothetical protein A3757_02800 [Oleiphilus sp. HI0117]KZZ56327.1 hypothetical protein A3761_09190 [Oleiphilus sp. HI0123]
MVFTKKISIPALAISVIALCISLFQVVRAEMNNQELKSHVCKPYLAAKETGELGKDVFFDDNTINLCEKN